MHSTSFTPPDITFVISDIKLQAEDDRWINLADGPIDISAAALVDRQILLKEAAVTPGLYKGIKLTISTAYMMGRSGNVNFALPQPGGEVALKSNISLKPRDSFVACLAWNPEKSLEKGYLFQPSIEVEPQIPSARELLLFISNSASNYISVIDRSLERVIGAVTVGDRPMGMVLNATKDRLYVVNSGSRTISIIDTTQFFVLDTIQLTAGIEPTDIAIIPDDKNSIEGKLYITNRLSNDVTVVSTTTKRVVTTIAVGTYPSAIAADTVRKEIYVTNKLSNNMSIISAMDNSLVANIAVDNRPMGIVVGKDKLYVFNEGSNRISVISPSLRKVVSTISVEGPPRRGMQGFSDQLFVVNTAADTLTFLNAQDVATRTIPVGNKPIGLAGDEKRNRLYITNLGDNTVSLIDPIGERKLKELFVGRSPYGALLLER
ncbi:MAG: hypothetical protein HY266_10160 [Deltaproteobacteria bacterium]|nr:hypothetical protein [Deltaproteobacteria bacterium]